jgi:uncharacterized integral membrane protein
MSQPPPPTPGTPGTTRFTSAVAFALRHWRPIARGAGLVLLLVFVLQNVEPTRVDVLFWSLPGVPKLVLILVSMALGGMLWEVLRRQLKRWR